MKWKNGILIFESTEKQARINRKTSKNQPKNKQESAEKQARINRKTSKNQPKNNMTPFEEITDRLREILVGNVDTEVIHQVESAVVLALEDYDLVKKERSIVVYDSTDSEIVERFFLAKAMQGCSRRTLEIYKRNLFLGIKTMNKHIKDITSDDIRIYLAKKKMQKASSRSSLATIHQTFSSFFTWATAEEWVEKNPMLPV